MLFVEETNCKQEAVEATPWAAVYASGIATFVYHPTLIPEPLLLSQNSATLDSQSDYPFLECKPVNDMPS
jgi:hypothetical protein